ncbi:hypothetical protein Pan153_02010 [Gimesia panareensis]|uniref:SCO6045-like C-terminal domain-containing protein n=1 Tax=Gimesia panareensis TaxID=2527978 RepID=A0A518FGX0_9PLAN|nr:hypothetical protein [Gimesia panareensis]QDV15587.1 hypothetical protein Pan153_02010 [Gimesia panareensis]
MNAPDTVRVLALLLHNQSLRDQLRTNPAAFIAAQELSDEAAQVIASLDCDQLDRQAEALLSKRRFQVAQIIPQTWHSLGPAASQQFQNYVEQTTWPESHQKHERDALRFCDYLQRQHIPGYRKSEHNWLKFRLRKCWFRIHWVTDLVIDQRRFCGIQVFGRNPSGAPVKRAFCLRRAPETE